MADWYVRTGGSDLNSGDSDQDAAELSLADLVVSGTNVSTVTGGLTGYDGRYVNINDGGVVTIRTLTVLTDTTGTIDVAPASGDGTYACKVGGAFASLTVATDVNAGGNEKLAANDTVYVQTGTYRENAIPCNQTIWLRASGGTVTVDGTGGAAGSDVFSGATGKTYRLYDIVVQNGVDVGLFGAATTAEFHPHRCVIQNNGGAGIHSARGYAYMSRISGNGGVGMSTTWSATIVHHCVVRDNTGNGCQSTLGMTEHCVFADNGGDGLNLPNAWGSPTYGITNCTFEGNTGDGLQFGSYPGQGTPVINNCFSNNGGYGVNAASGSTTLDTYYADYNNYYNNTSGDRYLFTTGANDTAVDPGFTDVATDDYAPSATSGMATGGGLPESGSASMFQGAIPPVAASGGGGSGAKAIFGMGF